MTLERSVCVYFVPKYRIILLVTDTRTSNHTLITPFKQRQRRKDVAMSEYIFYEYVLSNTAE